MSACAYQAGSQLVFQHTSISRSRGSSAGLICPDGALSKCKRLFFVKGTFSKSPEFMGRAKHKPWLSVVATSGPCQSKQDVYSSRAGKGCRSLQVQASAQSESSSNGGATSTVEHAGAGTGGSLKKLPKKLLCLSNGHGEDTIAVAILKELQALAARNGEELLVHALPIVGLGAAYARAGIKTIGPAQIMPSGGFLYMDRKQLVDDLQAGLLALTWEQWRAISRWTEEHGANAAVLAVGDIVPLALAWFASQRVQSNGVLNYGFVGTAKSEFYIRTVEGEKMKPERRDIVEAWISPSCVYLPWERSLMATSRCQLVAPRDGLTAEVLRQELPAAARSKVVDLGNPMMDNLEPTGGLDAVVKELMPSRCIAVLPGSRAPEVHSNFRLLLEAASATSHALPSERLLFLAPLVASLELAPFLSSLAQQGWHALTPQALALQQIDARKTRSGLWQMLQGLSLSKQKPKAEAEVAVSERDRSSRAVLEVEEQPEVSQRNQEATSKGLPVLLFESESSGSQGGAIIALVNGGFNDCLHWAEAGLAMAGTATEQLVGLGKPAFTLPGRGPQFTYAFAEAQSRLLGESVVLCSTPDELGFAVRQALKEETRLDAICENGYRRMGPPGAGLRIAEAIWISLFRRPQSPEG